jgi:hypothetical protein
MMKLKTIQILENEDEEIIPNWIPSYCVKLYQGSDGNATLPDLTQGEVSRSIARRILQRQQGREIEVTVLNGEQALLQWMEQSKQIRISSQDTRLEMVIHTAKRLANMYVLWAHFGIYGCENSTWVISTAPRDY